LRKSSNIAICGKSLNPGPHLKSVSNLSLQKIHCPIILVLSAVEARSSMICQTTTFKGSAKNPLAEPAYSLVFALRKGYFTSRSVEIWPKNCIEPGAPNGLYRLSDPPASPKRRCEAGILRPSGEKTRLSQRNQNAYQLVRVRASAGVTPSGSSSMTAIFSSVERAEIRSVRKRSSFICYLYGYKGKV